MAALSAKRHFFKRYPSTSEVLEHLYGTEWRLRRKLCHCVLYVFSKLQAKKYLRFSFDSPLCIYICIYIDITGKAYGKIICLS